MTLPPPRVPGRASTLVGKIDAASRAMDAREIAIFTMTDLIVPVHRNSD
jgi:hypothetical protein